ncbi:unnamed protein product [Echinostoma caproni]|uniref:RAB3GAP2_N domain-containing protein n=1 Tax=Echinostoma caproni TaxID=27848 RepID=A0A183BGU7_9TREM|nr:unnamed protein product [Echinostoma caproni]
MAYHANPGHQPDKDAFKVPQNKCKHVRKRHLAAAESVAIKIMNPPLCKQGEMVAVLQLPWSQPNLRDDPNHDLSHVVITPHGVTIFT